MAQVLPRYCPRCGAPFVTSSEVCATCGLPLETLLPRGKYKTSERVSSSQELLPDAEQGTTPHNPDQKLDDQIDEIPTEHLGPQNDSVSSTHPLTTKKKPALFSLSTQKSRKVGRREIVVLFLIVLF